jgi:hypothetical protein
LKIRFLPSIWPPWSKLAMMATKRPAISQRIIESCDFMSANCQSNDLQRILSYRTVSPLAVDREQREGRVRRCFAIR